MSADLSRVRFDPLRDFSHVILQQGRLLLDADFNELGAIVDRRLRAETVDLTSFGPDPDHAGSAWVPRHTPNGFEITADGGALTIGRGRMYVDGLLAENHGGPTMAFDPLLAELGGSVDTPYDEQPHWPTPAPLPSGGPHLVYLDVWSRQITSVEDVSLVEPAVAVDTTGRTQTVWQVRLLEGPTGGPLSCATPDDEIPGWSELIAPSAGRLSIDTIAVDDDDDPCALPPSGGYRGLENQTYRIEIHDGGAPGAATFKWSRENASVVQPVVQMVNPTTLRLASVGRDDVLRISTNDWVEIIDDHAELDQRPGVMRKVTVDDASRTITFTGALPADLQPVDADDAAARHLRVRRWDQSGLVSSATGDPLVDLDAAGSIGLITVPASATTQVVLERGIVVSFALADPGGVFRIGDHWIAAARTADTSVERVTAAPPQGIHHHYARLAVVTFPGSETDCRRLWPPIATGGGESCDCTVCVEPETHSSGALTVQAALDSVRETGGTVCLHAGVYDIGPGIDLDGARSVRLHGQGLATVLVARGDAVRVNRSIGIELDHFAVIGGVAADSVVSLRSSSIVAVEALVVVALGGQDQRGAAVRLSGTALDVALRRNILLGRDGIACGVVNPDGAAPGILGGVLRIEDNLVVGARGIDVGGSSVYVASVAIDRNDVVAGSIGGIRASGAVMAGSALRVSANTVWSDGPGIAVGADGIVDANTVHGRNADVEQIGDGIVVEDGFRGPPGHVRVTGNRVSRRGGAGIVLRASVESWTVKQNVVTDAGAGISIDGKGQAHHVSIENNQVIDIAARRRETAAIGIAVTRAESAAVVGNSVRRVGIELVEGRLRVGIAAAAATRLIVAGNVIDEIGPQEYIGVAAGIFVMAPFEQASVTGNDIQHGRREPPAATWFAVLIQGPFKELGSFGFQKAVVPLGDGEQTFVLNKGWAFAVANRAQHVTLSGNSTRSGGRRDGLLVRVGGDVVAEGNQMDHVGFGEPVALRIEARSVSVATNRARGPKAMIVLEVDESSFAALGNITAGGTHLGGAGAGLPQPWDALNPVVV